MTMTANYTRDEEVANSLTHGIGVGLSIAGLSILVVLAALRGSVWHIVSFSIFGVSLIVLYSASTLYHSFSGLTVKKVFRVLDHSAIYLLIAGTYTPFMLVSIRGPWGWSIFGVIWGCTIFGIFYKGFFFGKYEKISVAIYLIMGWLCLIPAKEIITNISTFSLVFLILGGLSYTFGVVFYAWQKLPYNHAIWHLFVLSGSMFHFFSILNLLPSA